MQTLQTLNKLEQVNGAVSMMLDKLKAIRGDLVDQEGSGGYKPVRIRARTTNTKTERKPKGNNLPHASWCQSKTPLLALCLLRWRSQSRRNVQRWQAIPTADRFSSTNVYVSTAPPETIALSIVPANLPVNNATNVTTRHNHDAHKSE